MIAVDASADPKDSGPRSLSEGVIRMRGVSITAPAKVNLCLSVGAIRPDGYHEVDTVMHVLELADEIRIEPAGELSLVCEPSVGVPAERNLAWRAAILLGERVGVEPKVAIRIDKMIPHEAGLGGGSSDAAATLAGLAQLWDIPADDGRLLSVAAEIGSDVPFFLAGAAAWMTGRGERLVRTLPATEHHIALIRPDAPVPTAAAYAAFDAEPQSPAAVDRTVEALITGDRDALAASLVNNLEVPAASVVPDVAVALAWVRHEAGVLGALLAGSGSAVFALVDTASTAERIAADAASRGWWGAATRLSATGLRVTELEGA